MSYRPYQAIIAEATGASTGQTISLRNQSGATISTLQPVTVDANGRLKAVDVSLEADALKVIGVAKENIPNNSNGDVVASGRFENITTSLNFGDYVYVSKSGGLTEILPSEGVGGFVSGDFIIRIGVITRNVTYPTQKDLLVSVVTLGQV
jgi:hypothetical protein